MCRRWNVASAEVEAGDGRGRAAGLASQQVVRASPCDEQQPNPLTVSDERAEEAVRAMAQVASGMAALAADVGRLAEVRAGADTPATYPPLVRSPRSPGSFDRCHSHARAAEQIDGALHSLHSVFSGLPPPEALETAMAAPEAPSLGEYLRLFADTASVEALVQLQATLAGGDEGTPPQRVCERL